jgi:hypothetical protein
LATDEDLTQLELIREPFTPMALGGSHYLVALQNRKGELDALRQAREDTWTRFTPLLHVVGPKRRDAPFIASTVSEWVRKIASAVGKHPIYIDLMRMRPDHPVSIGSRTVPVLQEIYGAARKRGLKFVPVVWAGHSGAAHIQTVSRSVETDGRGVAIRYVARTMVLPPHQTLDKYLEGILARLGVSATQADLIFDLDYLDEDADVDVTSLGDDLKSATATGQWRNIALIGTSMPSMLGRIKEGSLGMIPRHEWEIWSALGGRVARSITYGDYAVQHSRPPHEDGGPGMRANIRYTTERATLIARGRGSVLLEGKQQYRDLCRDLINHPLFTGREYSWGDAVISDCGYGLQTAGSQNMWRGVGTSHHIQFVTDQLHERRRGD